MQDALEQIKSQKDTLVKCVLQEIKPQLIQLSHEIKQVGSKLPAEPIYKSASANVQNSYLDINASMRSGSFASKANNLKPKSPIDKSHSNLAQEHSRMQSKTPDNLRDTRKINHDTCQNTIKPSVDISSTATLEAHQRNVMSNVINLTKDAGTLPINNDNFQLVNRRRPRRTTGKAEDGFVEGQNNPRKIWLFLTRIPDNVNSEVIKSYIHKKLGDEDIQVKMLSTSSSRPNNQSYMIGVKPLHKETVYSSTFWPKKTIFERFDFRRGGRFLREDAVDGGQTETFFA
nr:unnamed protein product [Callosobruchus analis]